MLYCEICRTLCPDGMCENEPKHPLREAQPTDFVNFFTRESMWAEMLCDALKDNDIPAVFIPHSTNIPLSLFIGYGMDTASVCVPYDRLEDAKDVEHTLFANDAQTGEPITEE